MLDELSGTAATAPSGLVLHAVFDSLTNLQPIAVTPLTEMAYQNAVAASGGLTTTNIDAANNAVSTLFLGGAPALYTQPIALSNYRSATVAQQALAKLLTALDVAASSGIAVDASGKACTGTYAQELVCTVSGLPSLLTTSSSGVGLTANAGYLTVAYTDLDDDASITVNGGQSPSQLGLDGGNHGGNLARERVQAAESAAAGFRVQRQSADRYQGPHRQHPHQHRRSERHSDFRLCTDADGAEQRSGAECFSRSVQYRFP